MTARPIAIPATRTITRVVAEEASPQKVEWRLRQGDVYLRAAFLHQRCAALHRRLSGRFESSGHDREAERHRQLARREEAAARAARRRFRDWYARS